MLTLKQSLSAACPCLPLAHDPKGKSRWAEGSKGFSLSLVNVSRCSRDPAAGKGGVREWLWCLWTQCHSAAKICVKKITIKVKTNKTQTGCKKRSLPELVWQGSHLVLAEPECCVPASDGVHDFFIQTRVPTCMLYPIENWTVLSPRCRIYTSGIICRKVNSFSKNKREKTLNSTQCYYNWVAKPKWSCLENKIVS